MYGVRLPKQLHITGHQVKGVSPSWIDSILSLHFAELKAFLMSVATARQKFPLFSMIIVWSSKPRDCTVHFLHEERGSQSTNCSLGSTCLCW